MTTLSSLILPAAVLAYALIGGIFLAFSDFIMRALAHTPGRGGVAAMQTINREVFRWIFMGLFLGMVAGSLALAAYGAFGLDDGAGLPVIAAALVYIIGCFGVTVFGNVPLNERLALMDAGSPDTLTFWQTTYLPRWTWLNSLRAGACILSASLILAAMAGAD